jgi:hypothetical protein
MRVNKMVCGLAIALFSITALSSAVWAVPYASGIDQSGTTVNFILNDDADNVIVKRSSGGNLNLGPLSKGPQSFDTGGAASYEIVVANYPGGAWTQISDDSLTQSKYFSPRGVTVNRNATSSNFGRIYVSEGLGGLTGSGRTTTDGLYVMGADQSDILSQGDSAAAGGVDWTTGGSNSPFKISIAPDNTVYIADWSDAHSGLWRAPADVSGVFPNVLANENRDAAGLTDNHGSIPSVWIEGTGAGTKVYTLDEDFDLGGTTGSVLRYDVGTATDYNGQPVEQTQDGTNIILNLRSDVVRDEDGSWWIAQYRGFSTAARRRSTIRLQTAIFRCSMGPTATLTSRTNAICLCSERGAHMAFTSLISAIRTTRPCWRLFLKTGSRRTSPSTRPATCMS